MSRFTLLNSQFANQNRCSEAPFAWILEKLTRTVGRMILPSPALRLTLAPDFSFEGVCIVYDRKNMAVFQYTKFLIEEQRERREGRMHTDSNHLLGHNTCYDPQNERHLLNPRL